MSKNNDKDQQSEGLLTEHQDNSPAPENAKSGTVIDPATEAQTLIQQTHYIGPLPNASEFRVYEEVTPGAGDRIISMAEKEQSLRETGQIHAFKNERLRTITSAIVMIGLLVLAGIAAWNGNAVIALPLGLAGLLGSLPRLLFPFLLLRKSKKESE